MQVLVHTNDDSQHKNKKFKPNPHANVDDLVAKNLAQLNAALLDYGLPEIVDRSEKPSDVAKAYFTTIGMNQK